MLKAQAKPMELQNAAFKKLQKQLRGTETSKRSGLESAASLRDFLDQARAYKYDDIDDLVQRQIRDIRSAALFHDTFEFVGLSSGTTGRNSKNILFNKPMIRNFEKFQMAFGSVIEAHSNVRLLSDQRLTWGSSAQTGVTPSGVPCGYVSGFLSTRVPKVLAKKAFPRPETGMIEDMTAKLQQTANEVRHTDLRLLSGVPTYLINLLEFLKDVYQVENFSEIWPNLSTVVYSATSIEPYRDQLCKLIGRPLTFIGCYVSTEGPIGYEIPSITPNGVYAFHLGDVVYSFRKTEGEDKRFLTLEDLNEGDEVEVFVSSPNGLLSYSMGDVIRIYAKKPVISFEIVGRVGQGLNVATEKATLAQLQKAVLQVSRDIRHFFVYPAQSEAERPCYAWTFFVDDPAAWDTEQVREDIDKALMGQNWDYEEARLETLFLDSPQVDFVSSDLLRVYFKQESHRGQLKMKYAFDSQAKADEFITRLLMGLEVNIPAAAA